VLVVDDEASILEGLRALLQEWGCEIRIADNEANAIAAVVDWPLPPDLVISDLRLREGRSGLDVLRALRGKKIDLEATDLLPRVCEMELISRGGDLNLKLFAKADGSGGLRIDYDDREKTVTIDRSQMARRFNTEQGEARVRPLPKGLFHLRIFIDRSSIEIFVNDGDAVFSSRIFPTPGEKRLFAHGDASIHLWELERAVIDDFRIE
jgi:beta-fructofuranosidase